MAKDKNVKVVGIDNVDGVVNADVSKKERKPRSPNKNASLNGIRASLTDDEYALLVEKEETSGVSRDLIVASAIRAFMSAGADVRKTAFADAKAARATKEVENI